MRPASTYRNSCVPLTLAQSKGTTGGVEEVFTAGAVFYGNLRMASDKREKTAGRYDFPSTHTLSADPDKLEAGQRVTVDADKTYDVLGADDSSPYQHVYDLREVTQ